MVFWIWSASLGVCLKRAEGCKVIPGWEGWRFCVMVFVFVAKVCFSDFEGKLNTGLEDCRACVLHLRCIGLNVVLLWLCSPFG